MAQREQDHIEDGAWTPDEGLCGRSDSQSQAGRGVPPPHLVLQRLTRFISSADAWNARLEHRLPKLPRTSTLTWLST